MRKSVLFKNIAVLAMKIICGCLKEMYFRYYIKMLVLPHSMFSVSNICCCLFVFDGYRVIDYLFIKVTITVVQCLIHFLARFVQVIRTLYLFLDKLAYSL